MHRSRPRNPLVAEVFFRSGIIERFGRGTLLMVDQTTQAGLTAPQWSEEASEVVVTFRPTQYFPPTRVAHDLSDLQQSILAMLNSYGPRALGELVSSLPQVPKRTLQDNLVTLRHYGLVELLGRGRGAQWKLKD